MRVLGLISGTSHDGIDSAVVDWSLDGDVLTGVVEHIGERPYDAALRARIVAALPPRPADMGEVCRLDTLIGQAFADAAAGCGPVDLVCSHGQTLYHWVEDGRVRGTLQLGQAAWIAERTGVPVVSDLRSRDVSAGGQGAPLVSSFDLPLLAGLPGRSGALNLGGIANLTVREPGLAYDTGPASALIDAAVAAATGLPYDEDGRLAAAGTVHEGLLTELLAEPYYRAAPPKSTGKELFHPGYLDAVAGPYGLALPDLVATLTALTAETAAAEIRRHRLGTVVASGGGTRNPVMMAMLRERAGEARIVLSDELGVPSGAKEAIAFSFLGWLTAHGLPGTVPECTGASGPRVLGSVTPGRGPLRLPEPPPRAPARLRMRTAST
ncbi:anhydro-N-acetylmuramic acid kinase [Streptosporangium sandarakinum]|uniref:Anhydro-N-acetylmuramic acid kinase n=1 Tax=Streptosporangium sandarakinum TaxID=1260955 RepID=A0A852V8A6_9ACTN|nr:anhydro-N-acetylmuramic acid kinase [Streptosporangium sandarakinum]NYF44310.1 anhydro-N-acetylmuramic acid kinase [Streptosporangium sandarakinum]